MYEAPPRAEENPSYLARIEEIDKRAFVSFYNDRKIIPVSQDVHHEDFVFRRNALYKTLGVPFEGLRGKAVLEFGPGGGFNAVAVTRYNPELLSLLMHHESRWLQYAKIGIQVFLERRVSKLLIRTSSTIPTPGASIWL